MGYEICYHFYARKEDQNGYETENAQTFTKSLGKLEEVPVEKLANAIMMQLARRDIMVFDVEIYEFTKRKISFKETKGGVLIKNKKFMLDGTVEVVAAEEEPGIPTTQQQNQQPQSPLSRPIRYEIFDPEQSMAPMLMKRFKITPRRRYPVYHEKTVIQKLKTPSGDITEVAGYEYIIDDDTGQKAKVPAIHFTPETRPLVGMENMPPMPPPSAQLSFMGTNEMDMPVLRR